MEILLLTLGATGFLALVDLVALRWGANSSESGDVPEWVHHHAPKNI